ncbi:tRNA-dihydrouridine synthase A [Mitosporidium daphniae]|uniref:tRNA-dihydrouridine synthase n=1 Tax=Mitosporidium daphniae TaxID=1485682 RepID=A0A098VTV4_9MICR|nr:tRNA-dihydrouridine synthase A [Mitosporidium daphniae]KGG52367.1 tRNA-dihydrouridine synthase A [Mitosporidium daphniae]|eukprot:XP_013238803.1 tRNA-dihydrouridine synthase A [Mitosporidium daphniae]
MNRILAAPMVAVSTANARRLVRLVHEMPVLYTEMLVDKSFLGKWDAKTVVQIASNSAPDFLDACKRLYNDFGYASFNLNCGCPSTKIACSASSGAALMLNPELVSKIIMNAADSLPMCSFSLKCRTGIDYNDSFEFFKAFIAKIGPSDKISIDVHARKAWLQGLSPKQNRTIPPINYDFVYKIASVFPCTSFSINGDIKCVSEIEHHLQSFSGNIMIGRSLYDNPMILYALSLSLDKTPDQLKYQLINEKRVAVVKEYCRRKHLGTKPLEKFQFIGSIDGHILWHPS